MILAVLGIAIIVLGYVLRAIFMPLLVAVLLAYILNPILTALEARRVPRMASIVGVYVVLTGFLAILVFWAIPAGASEVSAFLQEVQKDDSKARKLAGLAEQRLRAWMKIEDKDPFWSGVLDRIKGKEGDVAQAGYTVARKVLEFATASIGGFVTVLSFVALVPVYLFFLLRNMNPWWERFKHTIPRAYRDPTLRTLGRIHHANAKFFRGQLTISLIDGFIVFVALWIFGVKLPLLFGVLYAALSLLPFVGVVLGFAVTELFVLADTGQFGTIFLLVACLYVCIPILEAAVLQPLILGKETGLHPIAIILTLLICGNLFGFFGMLIAIPLAATVKILLEDYLWPMFEDVADLTRVHTRPATARVGEPPPPPAGLA